MTYADGVGMAMISPGTIRRVSAIRDSALPRFEIAVRAGQKVSLQHYIELLGQILLEPPEE
jgi:hypothetical protein